MHIVKKIQDMSLYELSVFLFHNIWIETWVNFKKIYNIDCFMNRRLDANCFPNTDYFNINKIWSRSIAAHSFSIHYATREAVLVNSEIVAGKNECLNDSQLA